VADAVERIAATYKAGHLIREGVSVALVGRPNVGKSSLFNALVGSERAIVTDIAGTTRDQIHERFTVGDIPVSLIDTAGLRETMDAVEIIGVARSKRTMADADQVVVILDASEPLAAEDIEIIAGVCQLRHVYALNKIDKLPAQTRREQLDKYVGCLPAASPIVFLSAKTGSGIDDLKRLIVEPFVDSNISAGGFLVTDARHHDLLVRADNEIRESIDLLNAKASEEIVLIGLHNALRYLGQITGETTTEDMLTRIFATFCIGK
jgi:tRNA modification GTPase